MTIYPKTISIIEKAIISGELSEIHEVGRVLSMQILKDSFGNPNIFSCLPVLPNFLVH
jgi:hypothetical protein